MKITRKDYILARLRTEIFFYTIKARYKHDKKHERKRIVKRAFLLLFVFFLFYYIGGFLTMPIYKLLGGF